MTVTMTAQDARVLKLLDLYEQTARALLNRLFKPDTCIEQTRVLLEVMRRFDVRADALGCKLHVVCDAKQFQFITGVDREEIERGRSIAKRFIERKAAREDQEQYKRHVVALLDDRFIVDSTMHQASSTEFGVIIAPVIVTLGPLAPRSAPDSCWDMEAVCTLDDGLELKARWITTTDRDWLDAPGWEPSHLWPLIDRIERDMRARIVQ